MYIIAFCLIADSSVLIFNPSLYRRSLDFVNQTLGHSWSVLYGLLFSFCSIFILISIVFSGISFLYIIAAAILALIGLFFLLSGTEKYQNLAKTWSTLSNLQYRLVGITFVILTAIVCYVTTLLRYKS